ncbi:MULTISPECIES: DUF4041 domain-containing protein [Aeromonas]|uniref:DUF4041 domain-containing protein n=1 Tax=Aeromonas TaxID=642 RepID=UPI0011165545|nr:DUF4041 domain-containing protein [Aeromonas hydrophila]MBM0511625.1 DUF4041 domain-containing protein [Aeromonas hydrophila]MBW3771625.1 DUF4041 domain-containing protein [Aeromonas hydrophila]TNH85315.1 ATPase [Aeromonas hydrophila]
MSSSDITLIIILAIIALPSIGLFVVSRKKNKITLERDEAIKEARAAKDDVARHRNLIAALEERLQPIIDMEVHIQKLHDDAKKQAKQMTEEADSLRAKAGAILASAQENARAQAQPFIDEAKELRAKARETVEAANTKAQLIEQECRAEAEKIISFANKRAEEIAGNAIEARDKAEQYESAIRAMRNTIEGYKDEYIVPNHSVLDDLADEFSYKEAGEKLKMARKRVNNMVKNGLAGECDYVEPYRRANAIHFAVDAFNGKVDTALAKVKSDNFGKIKQEITDAFYLVNHNGAPFRNARITHEYLDARLDELNWAVATYELQRQEREEQKAIREQMREEERAQREIEKAIQDAEKEERMLQKALEKARKELASANDEQRQQFEAQLAELEGKLKEAESRGQRALSMAQQTRRGHVYVISNIGSFGEQVFKVGMTRRLDPLDRVKELGDASVPFEFDVHAIIYSEDAPTLEKELHREFEQKAVNRVNPRKEFFRLPLIDIRHAVETRGLSEVHWTMKAEAVEYHESLSIYKKERALETKEIISDKEAAFAV